jgi:hypothetical protein
MNTTQKVARNNQVMTHISNYLAAMFPDCKFRYDSYMQRIHVRPPEPMRNFELTPTFDFLLSTVGLYNEDLAFMAKVLSIAQEAENKFKKIQLNS